MKICFKSVELASDLLCWIMHCTFVMIHGIYVSGEQNYSACLQSLFMFYNKIKVFSFISRLLSTG